MLTWNKFFRMSASALAVLILAGLWASNAAAQVTTLMSNVTFSSGLPSGWTNAGGFSQQSAGNGGSGGTYGSEMLDIWDYSAVPLSTPSINASAYNVASDSVWVDYDFFWEYNVYDADGYGDDTYELMVNNSATLLNGTESQLYTYYQPSSSTYNVVQSSSSDWVHYHVLIPVAQRTSSMTINFSCSYGWGCSDYAVTNVTITGKNKPPAELSLTPNPKTLNFGTATPNTPDTLYATIKSVGAAGTKLGISGIALSGASAYSIIPGGAKIGDSILVGGSEQVGIQFEPFITGTITGTLTVATTGADSGTQVMNLTGIGAVPNVSYSATQMFRGVAIELTDTSAIQYLYVNSTGVGPLLVESVNFIGLNTNNYIITHKPSVIAPGGVDSIGVRFIPTIEGLPDARLVINSSGVNDPWDTVLMFGVGILPHLQVSSTNAVSTPPNPLKVSFDSVNLGADSCLNITVSNPGSDTLAVEKNFFANADVDFSYTPLTGKDTLIPPGGSQTIQVCFDPVQQGFRTATLRLVTNIPHEETASGLDTNTYDIVIIGTGVPNNGGVLVGYGRTSDTSMVGTQSCWIDTVKNIGKGAATIDTIVIGDGGMTSTFPLVGTLPPFPYVLQADSILTFSVCSTPTDTGIWTDPSNFLNTGNYGPWAIAIRSNVTPNNGNPFFPQFFVYGTEIGDTAVVEQPFSSGCGPDTETVVVLNTENVPESYSAAIAGGSNPGDFTVLAPTTSQVESAGGSATFHVVFTPSTTSAETANLNISGGIPQTVALSAKGGAATIAGSDPAPMTAIGSTSGQFTVTVNNTGSCPWTTGVPTVDPQFSYVSGATTIAPNGSAPFVFTYSPTVAGGTSYPVSFPSSVGLSTSVNVSITTATDGVAMVSASNGYSLGQTYPNPFNDESNLEITVAAPGLVQLSVVDVQGNVVEQVLNRQFDAGTYSVTLSAEGLASGTYYYQMGAGGVTLTRQMVIVK